MKTLAIILTTALFAAAAHATPVISNASFETPDLTSVPNGFQYTPSVASQGGSGWTFTMGISVGGSGIAHNGSQFGNSPAPDGSQVAILQGDSTFSQLISGFEAATYTISFYDSLRDSGGANPFQITLDGTPLTTIIIPGSFPTFEFRTSDPFTVTAGSHTLAFVGHPDQPGADRTAFIDRTQINIVPEPTTLGLLAIGGFVALFRRRSDPQ